MTKKNNSPSWGGNKWTKSMFKKHWLIICLITLGCVLILITTNSFI